MTDPILDAIGAVRATLRDLTSRLETMVTRREHDAEVRRIDAEANATREALLRHENEADRRLTGIEDSIDTRVGEVLDAVEQDKKERAARADREAEQRKSDRHWQIGMVASACGLAVALGQLLTRWL